MPAHRPTARAAPLLVVAALALATACHVSVDDRSTTIRNPDQHHAQADRPSPPRIVRGRVAVLLIDAQPAFWKIMHGAREPVETRIEQLLAFCDLEQIPVIATFEAPPERNGWLPERLEKVFPAHGKRFVKRTFDCCREGEIAAALRALPQDQVGLWSRVQSYRFSTWASLVASPMPRNL